jgi:hypothetical protein
MIFRLITIAFAVALGSCGKRIHHQAPPAGCFALVAVVTDGVSQADLNDIEAIMRNTPGSNPYPEGAFAMAKGASGRTEYRATRKDDVDPKKTKAQIAERISAKGHASKVELMLIE